MSVYQALHMGFSAVYNTNVTRISLIDDRGDEYWTLIPTCSGKRYRDTRDRVLDALQDAIERGDEPGEVTTT